MTEAGFGVSVLAGFLCIVLGLPLVVASVAVLFRVMGRPNLGGFMVGCVLAGALLVTVLVTLLERYAR